MAQREVGLAAGEPPATRGYPPSVFGLLAAASRARRAGRARFDHVPLHRAGRGRRHQRTHRRHHQVDPRRPRAARRAHWPRAGTTRPSTFSSPSRGWHLPSLSDEVVRAGSRVRELLAAWRDARDLIEIDAYVPGTNAVVDRAVARKPAIDAFLRQPVTERERTRRRRSRAFSRWPPTRRRHREGVPLPSRIGGPRARAPGAGRGATRSRWRHVTCTPRADPVCPDPRRDAAAGLSGGPLGHGGAPVGPRPVRAHGRPGPAARRARQRGPRSPRTRPAQPGSRPNSAAVRCGGSRSASGTAGKSTPTVLSVTELDDMATVRFRTGHGAP